MYDMSPDTMQRIIEERHRYDDSEQDTFTFSGGAAGNSTAREHSLGCGSTSGEYDYYSSVTLHVYYVCTFYVF